MRMPVRGAMRRVLDRKTQAQRIASARELRGMKRAQLAKLFVAEGFGQHDIARLERADPKLTLTRPRWETLARLLRVPEQWFTVEDAELFDLPDRQMDRIERRLEKIDAGVTALRAVEPFPAPGGETGRIAEGSPPSDQDRRDEDSDQDTGAQPSTG